MLRQFRPAWALPVVRAALTPAAILCLLPLLPAQTLFTYSFADVTTSSGRTAAGGAAFNLQFGGFTATPTLSANSNSVGIFAFGSWVPGGATDQSDTFTGAPDPTEYFEFSISPDSGFTFTLTGISFSAGRTATGPRQFVLRSDADAFTANLSAGATAPLSVTGPNVIQFTDNATTNLVAGQSFALGGADFTELDGARVFRLYAYNAEGSGTLRLDDVAIAGTVSAVPEPAACATAAGLAALFARAIARRRRSAVQREIP